MREQCPDDSCEQLIGDFTYAAGPGALGRAGYRCLAWRPLIGKAYWTLLSAPARTTWIRRATCMLMSQFVPLLHARTIQRSSRAPRQLPRGRIGSSYANVMSARKSASQLTRFLATLRKLRCTLSGFAFAWQTSESRARVATSTQHAIVPVVDRRGAIVCSVFPISVTWR